MAPKDTGRFDSCRRCHVLHESMQHLLSPHGIWRTARFFRLGFVHAPLRRRLRQDARVKIPQKFHK